MHLAPPDNDFALLDRFAAGGDEEAFAEIVRRYAGVVYATSFRVVHDRARAEDVSQEVFFRLLRRPQAVSQSLGGWLHQCATRLALDEVRSETARRKREANRRVETGETEEQTSTWQEISPYVDEALATLPEESRELLISHFLQGKSQSAIAIETRTSPATISRRMRDAVTALRAELRQQGIMVAPALLIGLCRMNAPAQAAAIPSTLMSELGKMAIVGKPAAASFAWNSVSAWCDAAAKTWGWNAELVKQAVAAAASTAVAVTLTVLIVRTYASMHPAKDARESSSSSNEERHLARGSAEITGPPTNDVRVSPASERDPRRIVLFHRPAASDDPIIIVYGDSQTISLPQPLARKLIEAQAGKTLEQLADESNRSPVP
jgi:RNA polymerase sigma factor (sigma-70 family)